MSPRSTEEFKKIRSESKTKIMVAALELFAIDGYHNTAISKIAKHAGISKGLMYNYFVSKEELLVEVVSMSINEAKEEGHEILKFMENATPQEILRSIFDLFFKLMLENTTMWKLTFSLALQVSSIPSIEQIISNNFKEVFTNLEMILQLNGFQNSKVEAKLLAAQMDGIFLHYIIFEKTYNLEEVKLKLIEKYCGPDQA